MLCENCGNETRNKRFCSLNCFGEYKRSKRFDAIDGRKNINIADKKNILCENMEEIDRCGSLVRSDNRQFAKKYLLSRRGCVCAICKNTEWQGSPIPLVVDHVDGDYTNGAIENLRLVCGNCNMLLPTFAGRNRGKGRHLRRKRYQEGKSY